MVSIEETLIGLLKEMFPTHEGALAFLNDGKKYHRAFRAACDEIAKTIECNHCRLHSKCKVHDKARCAQQWENELLEEEK